MKIEELARHIEQFPAGSDVDVYVGDDGARFLVASPPDDAPLHLMLAGPADPSPPEPEADAMAQAMAQDQPGAIERAPEPKPKRTRSKKAD